VIRLLHTADLHLDAAFPSLGDREEARRDDFLVTFDRLVDLALEREVDLFLVAGDLFDSWQPSLPAVERVQAGLQSLVEEGVVPVLLPGTHDCVTTEESVYRKTAFPGAVLLDGPRVDEPAVLSVRGQDVLLYGFAFRAHASEGALGTMVRRDREALHIGLLHGSRQGSPEWDYRQKDLPFTMEELRGWELDYLALGHYHNFEILEEDGRVLGCYPGSPEAKRFGEEGQRWCAIVSLDGTGASVERVEVGRRRLEKGTIDLGACGGQEGVVGAIDDLASPDLLLRLSLTGIVETPIETERLLERCRDGFFHLEIRDRTRMFDSRFVQQIEEEETVRGVFVRKVREFMEQIPSNEREEVEAAFREVLVRFQSFGGRQA